MDTLNLYYQNVCGLRTKTSSLLRNIYLNTYDIIALTETWLLDSISNAEMFDARYIVWRRDRDYARTQQEKGGGVLLAVHRDFVVTERQDWRSSAEDIWVTLSLRTQTKNSSSHKIHLCVVYLCDENLGLSHKKQLQNFMDKLSELVLSHSNDQFIIMGDFNLQNFVTWTKADGCAELEPTDILRDDVSDFVDVLNVCNLSQYNWALNKNQRILDLVLSNNTLSVYECSNPLIREDPHHKSINIQYKYNGVFNNLNDCPRTKYLYHKGNFDLICSELDQTDWQLLLKHRDLNLAVTYFYDKLNELRTKYIPQKYVKNNYYPPWYNTALIKILKEKHKYHQKYKVYNNKSDYLTFSVLRQRAKDVEDKCFKSYMIKIENSIIKDPKSFWSYIKSKKNTHLLPNLMKYNHTIADTGEAISDLFGVYFQSTFRSLAEVTCNNNIDLSCNHDPLINNISAIEVSSDEVLKLLRSLDLKKSGGPDDIPPIFIVNCASSIVEPLCILYKRSLSEGTVPCIWKSAFVTPVHKKGDKSNVENYRPISKLCLFAKILERLVFNQVYSCLKSYFSEDQHGFLQKRSTTSNLLLAADHITKSMEDGAQIDIVYTDYSKCFDRIDHRILLAKLAAAGIHGDLFRWFSSYIDNRSQAVVLQGFKSSWAPIPSGVPQGSLLGPLLFVIFINDVKNCFLNSKILLFADDMKIFKTINTLADCYALQEDLNRFVSYCIFNKLDLNVSKCFYMSFTRRQSRIDFIYTLNNQAVQKVDFIRDLGVIFDSALMFDKHVEQIVSKATKALGFIMRSSANFQNIKTIKILYCAYVRSHLEYASQVWNPRYEVYKSRIERVQKKFLRYLDYKTRQRLHGYTERCRRYHFLPLDERRNINDICYLCKIANGSIDCPDLLSSICLRTDLLRLRRRPLIDIPIVRTNYRENSFTVRACKLFNQLDPNVDIDLFCTSATSIRRTLASLFFDT